MVVEKPGGRELFLATRTCSLSLTHHLGPGRKDLVTQLSLLNPSKPVQSEGKQLWTRADMDHIPSLRGFYDPEVLCHPSELWFLFTCRNAYFHWVIQKIRVNT